MSFLNKKEGKRLASADCSDNALMANIDSTFEEEIFHLAQRQRKNGYTSSPSGGSPRATN